MPKILPCSPVTRKTPKRVALNVLQRDAVKNVLDSKLPVSKQIKKIGNIMRSAGISLVG